MRTTSTVPECHHKDPPCCRKSLVSQRADRREAEEVHTVKLSSAFLTMLRFLHYSGREGTIVVIYEPHATAHGQAFSRISVV